MSALIDEAHEFLCIMDKQEYADEVYRLRARVAELEAQISTGDYDYTVDEICNAYESGVGHRGRPTAHVNPYKPGSDLATAYAIGAVGDREAQVAAPAASRALEMLTSAALDHYTPHMVCVPSTAWSEAMRIAYAAPADHSARVLDMVAPAAAVADVPDAKPEMPWLSEFDEGYREGWNACRDEMLAARQPGDGKEYT